MSGAVDPRDVLRRALVEIRGLKERLAKAEGSAAESRSAGAEPVAVIGMGCRFPGAVDGSDAFWRLLIEGRDAIRPRPPGRWRACAGDVPAQGGFLEDVEGFDAGFFAIAPREAAAMDPQHRLLLEVAWEALEHAAVDPSRLAGSQTGVFVGLATNDYARRVPAATLDRYFGSGSSPAVAAGRLSYLLDLRGPCVTFDTACSSSLVAVHYALRALREGECDLALAGGVNLILAPDLGRSFAAAGMLAPDGRCKSFDAAADGYGRSEGCGVVVLKRLTAALRDGDPLLAVLRGSAINQDGRSAGLTAPNGPAQSHLVRRALSDAGLAPCEVDAIEAHGTGTPLGDPIEMHALASVFAAGERERPLLVGSVKANIGHTEAAAGVAGLIKATLMVGHDTVPPSLNFTRLNPAIRLGGPALEVPVTASTGVRRVGVSAFGFSGTNAHVVVEAPPKRPPVAAHGDGLLLLSAREPEALEALAARYAAVSEADWLATCHTAATGRARLPWWVAARTPAALAAALPTNAPPPELGPTAGPRIALPTYPFRRQRFPLPAEAPAGPLPEERDLTPGMPLFASTEGGLAHLGILLELLREAAGGSLPGLADIAIPAPLRLTAPRRLRLRRDKEQLALESRAEDEEAWSTHILAQGGAAAPGEPPPHLAVPAGPATALYDRIAAYGFRFGPEACWLERVAVQDGSAEGWLTERGATAMHPGMVEAAAQLVYALLPQGSPAVMLAGAKRLATAAGGVPARAWARCLTRRPNGGLVCDLGLVDRAGQALLHLAEADFAPLPDLAARWSRRIVWRPVPLPVALPVAGTATEPLVVGSVAGLPWLEYSPAAARAELLARPGTPLLWFAPDGEATATTARLLALLREIEGCTTRLCIVTRGAQATGREMVAPELGQAALWGMAQAVIAERPAVRCRLLDLDPQAPPAAQLDALRAEAAAEDEAAVAWRAGCRLARRLEPLPEPPAPARRAVLPCPGVVAWEPADAALPGAGMVQIEVVAAGLTFRDRLLFGGLGPARAPLGADCAGVVTAVGPSVGAGIEPGRAVVALAGEAIADSLLVPARQVAPAPVADLAAAATMPVPYLTALAGLPPRLGPTDCVLVHQAGSATGLAALEVARRAGARIVATASRAKHPWFQDMPLDALLDSRDPAGWGPAIHEVTVAFGAFEAEAVAAVPATARVINLSKRAAGHFDLDRLDPGEWLGRLGEDWPPLPRRLVAREELAEALGGSAPPLIGRPVVLLREPPPVAIESGATYLVTGAAGALGMAVAAWLAAAGARLCLVDCQPVSASAGHAAMQVDVADAVAMTALFDRLATGDSPLRGVFHCAAITDDGPLGGQSAARVAAVLAAKVDGALVLDRLTREHCTGSRALANFVLFSSLVSLLPSASQGGYAAANAVLDQIAHARRQRGLPALAVNWGPWSAGIGARMGARAAETWRRFGVTPILPALALRALPRLLAAPEPQRVVADLAWEHHGRAIAAPAPAAETPLPPPEPGPVTAARLQEILAPILGASDPRRLDPDTPLMALGFDSLMAVDFARALSRSFGRPVSPTLLYSHPTLTAAAAALSGPKPAIRRVRFEFRAPRWESAPSTPIRAGAVQGWAVLGSDPLAAALNGTPGAATDLVALCPGPVEGLPAARAARDGFFRDLLATLPAHPGRLVLVTAMGSPLAGAVEGFAAGLRAEQPGRAVRTVLLETGLAEAAAALARELAIEDHEERVLLGPRGRQVLRLRPLDGPAAEWLPDAEATYLVTGGSGGIGERVAAHLVARGARHLVLASRAPRLPPALAGSPARIHLWPADLGDAAAVAALMAKLRVATPPLRGIFHAAGATADGGITGADWQSLGRGFPAKADGALLLDQMSRALAGIERFVLFSSTTAWFGLPGTAGYAAANGCLDALAAARHAAGLPAQSIAWGAWEGVGMAADPALWADGRVPSLGPEAALAALDAALALADEPNLVVLNPGWRPPGPSPLLDEPTVATARG
jgi:acyl transferase domain-containing protein/acyl carrier protein